ncbi:MAG: peptide chain release factor 2 [Candidatus Saccharimonadales bacterium]
MEELQKKAVEISKLIDAAALQLKISELSNQLGDLQKESTNPDFWNDSSHAQNVMQEISKLETKVKPWQELQKSISEAQEMTALNDPSLTDELTRQLDKIEKKFEKMKDELKLNGPYDDHDAILSIYAGAGGTDAQDWAQMLLRMYSRFFEKNGWKAITIDQSSGEEAGLKSVTLTISGVDVYGKLKGEHGVHRLVRLSPFNSDNLRQTSFAKVEIVPKIDKPNEVELDEKDLKIDVYRSGGHGGQSVNTTDSAVRVTHIPTGLTVAIQNERSQLQNKETALTILRSRLAQLQLEQHKDHLEDLKGPNQSAEWGNQIRSYVLHPYKQVKDLRTKYESSDPDSILDGELQPLIDAYLEYNLANK